MKKETIPCRDCGTVIEKYYSRFLCESCAKKRIKARSARWRREWYAKNKEEYLPKQREWYAKNADRCRESQKRWRQKSIEYLTEKRKAEYERNKEAHKDRVKKWQRDNPEKKRESRGRWKENNRDKFKEMRRASDARNRGARIEYRKKNTERLRNVYRMWVERNWQKKIAHNNMRRIRKIGAAGHHSVEQFIALCDARGWRCEYCGVLLTHRTATRDHKMPLSRGGSDFIENIALSCLSCNCSKNTKTADEFMAIGGRQFCSLAA